MLDEVSGILINSACPPLTGPQTQLEAAVPSTTLGKQSTETQQHAQALRGLMESLEDIRRERADLLRRAQERVHRDDPTPRVLNHALSIQRWTEIEPRMFDDCFSENMTYYEDVQAEIEKTEPKQNALLKSLMVRCSQGSLTT